MPDDGTGGHPELWLACPGHAPVQFTFKDELRADAADVIAKLRDAGLEIELLSGRPCAGRCRCGGRLRDLALAARRSTPAAKADRLAELRAAGRRPLMVGDGLNDAPALAGAYVSVSPSTAMDVSQTLADVVYPGRPACAAA